MNVTPCPNLNHREMNPPVRFCPNCGKFVNKRIAVKQHGYPTVVDTPPAFCRHSDLQRLHQPKR